MQQPGAPSIELNAINELLRQNASLLLGKFRENNAIPAQIILKDVQDNLARKVVSGKARVYSQSGFGGKLGGLLLVENSDWDSSHFGLIIGRISLVVFDNTTGFVERRKLLSQMLSSERFRMISVRIDLLDISTVQAIEHLGGILTDILVTFRFDSGWQLPNPPSNGIRTMEAVADDSLVLAPMAEKLFTIDRFHSDPSLPRTKSDQVYSQWVLNSFRGFASTIIVAKRADKLVGFITCKIERLPQDMKYGVIDLVGVDSTERGVGIGSVLVRAALEWFVSRVPSVYVGTQGANTHAVKLYERNGFRHVCSEATLHVWSKSE